MTESQRNELFQQAANLRDEAQELLAMLIRFDRENLEAKIAAQKAELAAREQEEAR
jgi:hypothetical protein